MAEHKSERVHNTRKICNRFHIGHYKIFNEPELIEPMCIFRLYVAPWLSCVWMYYFPHFCCIRTTQKMQYFLSFHLLVQAFILNFVANRRKKRERNNGISSLFDGLQGVYNHQIIVSNLSEQILIKFNCFFVF